MIEQEPMYTSPRVEWCETGWTRHVLSDAWESMIAETKPAIEDQPRMLVKELLEVECRKFYVLYANIDAHGHLSSCPGYALLFFS